MKAGREMNALVAEKVMGWTLKFVGAPSRVWAERDTGLGREHEDHWSPSTSIHYAWQVVEKLSGDGDEHPACIQKGLPAFGDHATPFEVYKNYAGYPGWTCYFADYEVCAHADTAPLAICKAALMAVGVEVESPK